jgi:hypothetical protein
VTWDEPTESYVPSDPEPLHDTYDRWGAALFKEWYLTGFQKLRGEIDYLGGSDLDRFSQYQFSYFGDDRLWGFSGTGVRFDRGSIARAGYSFNVFEAIRFGLDVETARVERIDSGEGYRSFTGVGLSGDLIGPWKTAIRLGFGYALASDIPDLEGSTEYAVWVLKLF